MNISYVRDRPAIQPAGKGCDVRRTDGSVPNAQIFDYMDSVKSRCDSSSVVSVSKHRMFGNIKPHATQPSI